MYYKKEESRGVMTHDTAEEGKEKHFQFNEQKIRR